MTSAGGAGRIFGGSKEPQRHFTKVKTSADLTEGPLLKKIILFTLPIIATGILQLLFNAADIIVVGNSADGDALSAVGSTGALINLIVNLLLGLSVGAGVLAARYFGAGDQKSMFELVHTSMPTAAAGGILFGLVGFFFADIFLKWMDTPADVLGKAALYVRIYSIGIPFSIVYNFGAAILRSAGDTTRPLIFLVTAGVLNVIFNCMFVFAFGMAVDGVAWATSISQFLSAVLIVVYMMRVDESYRFRPAKMKIYGKKFWEILVIGVPAGVQGALFSVSNVIIQRAINGFGKAAIAGNASAANLEGFVYTAMNSFHQTAVSFTGQHIGAGKERKTVKILLLCLACTACLGLILGVGGYLLAEPLLGIYSPGRADIIAYGVVRLRYVCLPYFLCGVMDVFSGSLRGMGYSVSSMLITLTFACGFRILWVNTYFVAHPDLDSLLLSYPVSWILCVAGQAALFVFAYLRMMKKLRRAREEAPARQE